MKTLEYKDDDKIFEPLTRQGVRWYQVFCRLELPQPSYRPISFYEVRFVHSFINALY